MRALDSVNPIQNSPYLNASKAQIEISSLEESFGASFQSVRSFAPLLLGAWAGQLFSLGTKSILASQFVSGAAASGFMAALGLGVEVAAYEAGQEIFSLATEREASEAGKNFGEAYLQFGFLRATATLFNSGNLFIRHLFQDFILVSSAEVFTEGNRAGSGFLQKMLDAEVQSLHFSIAHRLGRGMVGGRVEILSRNVEISRSVKNFPQHSVLSRRTFPAMGSEGENPPLFLTPVELRERFGIHAVAEGKNHRVIRLTSGQGIRGVRAIRVHTPESAPKSLGVFSALEVSPNCRIQIDTHREGNALTHWVQIKPVARVSPRSHPRWLGMETQTGTAPEGFYSEGFMKGGLNISVHTLYFERHSLRKRDE